MPDFVFKPWVRFVFALQDALLLSDARAMRLVRFPMRLTFRGREHLRATAGRKHRR